MRSRAILVWKIVGPLWVRAALGIKGIARIPDEVFLDTDGVTRFPSTYPCGLGFHHGSYLSSVDLVAQEAKRCSGATR